MNKVAWLTADEIENCSRQFYDVLQVIETRTDYKTDVVVYYLCLLKEKESIKTCH